MMVQKHNAVVKPNDTVIHLGDVYFRDGYKVLPRLKGKMELLLGNHDDPLAGPIYKHFKSVKLWHKFKDRKLILTHIPMHVDGLRMHVQQNSPEVDVFTNVHGHDHDKGSPPGPYLSVCVELTDYAPVNLDEIKARL